MTRPGWDGTFDGLTEWEKTLVSVGYELGTDIGQRNERLKHYGCAFTDAEAAIFAEVIRKRLLAEFPKGSKGEKS